MKSRAVAALNTPTLVLESKNLIGVHIYNSLFGCLVERITKARNERVIVKAEHAVEKAVVLIHKQEIGACNHDTPLRIVGPQVAGEEDFIHWIRCEQNAELRVVLLEFADDAQHNGFLRLGHLAAREGRDGIVVIRLLVCLERKRGFSIRDFYAVLRLCRQFLLISSSEERNFARKVKVNDFPFVGIFRIVHRPPTR